MLISTSMTDLHLYLSPFPSKTPSISTPIYPSSVYTPTILIKASILLKRPPPPPSHPQTRQQLPQPQILHSKSSFHLPNLRLNLLQQALQASLRELQTLRPPHVLQHHLLQFQRELPRGPPLLQDAEKLRLVTAVLNGVDEGEGEFAFVEVFAEAFLGGVLWWGGVSERYMRVGWTRGEWNGAYLGGHEVLVVVADLEVAPEEGDEAREIGGS